jgi:YaiO family outer membrane protein
MSIGLLSSHRMAQLKISKWTVSCAAAILLALAFQPTRSYASATHPIVVPPPEIDSADVEDTVIAESPRRVYPRLNEILQMELGASYDHLSNGYDPWWSTYLQASYPFGEHKTLYGQIEYINEYALNDGAAFAGLYYPLTKDLTGIVEGKLGFTHKLEPVWSLFGQLNYKIIRGLVVDAGLRNSEYQSSLDSSNNEVQLFNIGGEYWFSYFRAAYTFYESRGNGGVWNPPSHLLELGYYYGDANSLTLGAGMGHEVERIAFRGGSPFLAVYDTKTVFLLGRHWLSWAWGVSYELGWHELDHAFSTTPLYDRYGIRLGIRHRF